VIRRLLRGAVAGAFATAPMSLVMLLMQRALPGRREPLPPRQITEELLDDAQVGAGEPEIQTLTLAGHFGYGALCGVLYALLPRGVLAGTMFGLLVWTVSYLGLLPAAGLFPPATEKPACQNALMIAAHIIWGASLGILLRRRES
jgi:putative membrane protein